MTQAIIKTDPFPPLKMPFDEFVEWAVKNEISAEWVDGEVEYKHIYTDPLTGEKVKMVSEEHSALVVLLVTLLNTFNLYRRLGRVYADQYLMRLPSQDRGREPDVIFLAKDNTRAHVERMVLEGPADLVIEVVSEDSIYRDRVTKKGEYERGGVREYWRLDPMKQQAFFYLLGADELYQEAALDAEGKFHSAVLPGLHLRIEWLWEGEDLDLPTIQREWGLV